MCVCVRACVRVDSPLQPSHDGILTMTTATVAVVGFVDDDVCNSVVCNSVLLWVCPPALPEVFIPARQC